MYIIFLLCKEIFKNIFCKVGILATNSIFVWESPYSPSLFFVCLFFSTQPRICYYWFERERKRNVDVKEKHDWLPSIHAPTRNGAHDLSVYEMTLHKQLNYTGQGSPSLLKDKIAGYRIQNWWSLSLNALNISLHSLLAYTISKEKSHVILIFGPLIDKVFFSLFFQHFFIFDLTMMCWGVVLFFGFCLFFEFILLVVLWTSYICGLISDNNLGKFSITVFQTFLLFLFFFSSSGLPVMYMLHLL